MSCLPTILLNKSGFIFNESVSNFFSVHTYTLILKRLGRRRVENIPEFCSDSIFAYRELLMSITLNNVLFIDDRFICKLKLTEFFISLLPNIVQRQGRFHVPKPVTSLRDPVNVQEWTLKVKPHLGAGNHTAARRRIKYTSQYKNLYLISHASGSRRGICNIPYKTCF